MAPNSAGRRLRVFVSSTDEDLKHYVVAAREAIAEADCVCDQFKSWPATGRPSVSECMEHVEESDVLIVVVATLGVKKFHQLLRAGDPAGAANSLSSSLVEFLNWTGHVKETLAMFESLDVGEDQEALLMQSYALADTERGRASAKDQVQPRAGGLIALNLAWLRYDNGQIEEAGT